MPDIGLLLPLFVLLLFIPIFLSSRKQRKQMQQMQELQNSLQPGDVVVTTSGLRGIVVDTEYEETVDLEISDGVVTTWVRAAIREKVVTDGDVADDAVHTDDPVRVDDTAPPSLTKAPTSATDGDAPRS